MKRTEIKKKSSSTFQRPATVSRHVASASTHASLLPFLLPLLPSSSKPSLRGCILHPLLLPLVMLCTASHVLSSSTPLVTPSSHNHNRTPHPHLPLSTLQARFLSPRLTPHTWPHSFQPHLSLHTPSHTTSSSCPP